MDGTSRRTGLRSAFTLIELILTIALLVVIGSASVFLYSNVYLRGATGNTSDKIVFSMRKAQMYSMMGRQGGSWGVTLVGGSLVLFRGPYYNARSAAFDEKITDIPGTVSITGFNETVFAKGTGYANETSTVTITGAGSTRKVQIQPQGIVSQF